MNANEYILSGAIEACVMGLANTEDWQELEQMLAVYPEVKAEKERLEMEMERQHIAMSVTPPPALKQKIMAAMVFNKPEEEATIIDLPESIIAKEEKAPKPSVVPIVPVPKPVKWLQRAVAVSVILLMGSILLNFYFYSKSVTYREEYDALLVQQNSVLARNEALESSFRNMKNPGMKQVIMGATPAQPGSMATIYWDDHSKDVYLLVNNLPKPAAGKQYQLWAIVDGKPVSAGMVPAGSDSLLMKMSNISNAQAFAITLEKEGGSPTPDMNAMFVIGKV